MGDLDTNNCRTCGIKCQLKECTNCWEVEKRLAEYVMSEKGKAFVKRTLDDELWNKCKREAIKRSESN